MENFATGTGSEATSFKSGIARLLPRLWRFALALSKNQDTADDLVQATCVRALEREDQFTSGSRLDSWLYTILSSIWKNHIRAQKIRNDSGFIIYDRESSHIENENIIETRIFLQQVLNEIENLPEAQRVTLFLAYVEGYKYQEISEILDIPLGTVMSRLAIARKKLSQLSELPPHSTTKNNIVNYERK